MNLWQIDQFGIRNLWGKTKGEDIKVAVLDTGIDKSHPDLNSSKIILTKNFIYKGSDEGLQINVDDSVGHGTHCAGIIAAQGIKAAGVAPNIELMIGKVVDSNIGADQEKIAEGIEWAYKNDADIISVSITIDKMDKQYQDAINNLNSQYKGILVGALSDVGDLGFDIDLYPFKLESCLAVGAINQNFKIDQLTARSSFLDILAPGRGIYSTWKDNSYKEESGCSMATPYVAGVLALFLSLAKKVSKSYKKEEVVKLLKSSTNKFASYNTLADKKFPVISPETFINKLIY